MGRSTVHYADNDTNNILKKLHNKLRPAGTPVQRVEYIIELLLLPIFEVKLKQEPDFKELRELFSDQNEDLLFSALFSIANDLLLANPPFGAERDQEAYPNVWEEYPRESETTILFVKLMLDALAPGGCCAVVVSEGFLTWDQTSARTLRKMLIETADLRAVISLPQGAFVSKGGVGPKTSILVFEKGGPTKEVWFYKVANDGYSMGTNRRPIER